MKKQILFKNFILLFVAVIAFGILATPAQANFAGSLSATPWCDGTNSYINLTWSPIGQYEASPATSWRVYRGSVNGPATATTQGTGWRDNNRAYNTSYTYSVYPDVRDDPSDSVGATSLDCTPINGSCGTTRYSCTTGTSASHAGTGPWTWSCDGSGTGIDASCVDNSATVTVSNTCTGGTWTSSTGNTSSPFTIADPGENGTTVTITLTSPSGYRSVYNPSSSQSVTRGSSKTFGLSCQQIQIIPTLSASPNPYTCGGTTTLTWGQLYPENTTSCSAGWTSSTNTSGTQVVSPTNNPHTYGITCYGANDSSGSKSIDVPMTANSCNTNTASVTLTADATTITSGNSTTLRWSGANISSCNGSSWTTSTATSGSQAVSPIQTTTYSMTCASSVGGTNPTDSETVTVVPANSKPVVTLTASPTSGTVGVVNPTLTWSSTGSPTFCAASGDWSGTKTSPGSASQGILNTVKTYTYTLACSNAYGTSTTPGSATVVVSAAVVNGSCGATPTHWSCAAGTAASSTDTATAWNWKCNGSGTGHTDASCSQAVPTFTYSLSNGGTVSVNRGSTVTNTVTRTAGTGTQAPVTLSATVLPPDLTIQGFSNQSCTPTCTSTITFGANNSATVGPHTVTVGGGTPASSNGNTSFTVNVDAGGSPVVSCSPSSSSALVGQPVTWSANVSGGTPPYTYVWSGTGVPTAPAPTHTTSNTTDTYANTYTTTGLKHATVRVTDAASNFGDCVNGGYPGSDVQINFNPTFQEF